MHTEYVYARRSPDPSPINKFIRQRSADRQQYTHFVWLFFDFSRSVLSDTNRTRFDRYGKQLCLNLKFWFIFSTDQGDAFENCRKKVKQNLASQLNLSGEKMRQILINLKLNRIRLTNSSIQIKHLHETGFISIYFALSFASFLISFTFAFFGPRFLMANSRFLLWEYFVGSWRQRVCFCFGLIAQQIVPNAQMPPTKLQNTKRFDTKRSSRTHTISNAQ